ncbi:bleomycin resistance family protein [Dyella sp. KRB-257]|uniref:bleomycin resistance family protein n=1 Tax=Dyella sp. KRB-257 TaxID=3400915 RepID=UPI003BFB104B
MLVKHLTPILNVSDVRKSFVWFQKLGWTKGFEWGDPTTFGSVYSGPFEVFLCQGGQGGSGASGYSATFGPNSNEAAEKGVWMSVWVEDVDAIHQLCLENEIEVTWPPTNMPWGVREMHVRHPDGHVFRVSCAIDPAAAASGA